MIFSMVHQKRRIAEADSDITAEFLMWLWDAVVYCKVCGKRLDEKRHVDHILPNFAGGTSLRANVRYLCP